MSYGRTFPLWRAAAGDHWPPYPRHAFVEGLRDGSLSRAAFLHYLVQDYLFLVQFARAWALAVTKADTIEDMRICAAITRALIDEEMRLHVGDCAEEGIDENTLFAAEERVGNLAYTRFVLDAGQGGDMLDLLAALAPCALGYGEIGLRLKASAGATPYSGWIDTYAGADYQAGCADIGALIDRVAARRLGPDPQSSPRWPDLCRTFTTATRLEVGFWDMGLDP